MYNIEDGKDKDMKNRSRLKRIVKKLKSKGKWDVLSKIAYKYQILISP